MPGERAYTAGWSASMSWQDREPPPELDEHERAIWLRGFDDAMDEPFGSGPEIGDLMRVCRVWERSE